MRGGGGLLAHLYPPLPGDQRRIHVVDLLVDPALEDAVQRGDREEPRVPLGQLAEVLKVEARRVPARQLHRERTELGRERQVRAQLLHILGCDGRAY